jgi:hypothetical protein
VCLFSIEGEDDMGEKVGKVGFEIAGLLGIEVRYLHVEVKRNQLGINRNC